MRHILITHCECQQQEPVQEQRVFKSSSRFNWFPYLHWLWGQDGRERAEKQNTKVVWEQLQKSLILPATLKIVKLTLPAIHCDLFLTDLIHAIIHAKRILKARHALSSTKDYGSWGTRGALIHGSGMEHQMKQNKPHQQQSLMYMNY